MKLRNCKQRSSKHLLNCAICNSVTHYQLLRDYIMFGICEFCLFKDMQGDNCCYGDASSGNFSATYARVVGRVCDHPSTIIARVNDDIIIGPSCFHEQSRSRASVVCSRLTTHMCVSYVYLTERQFSVQVAQKNVPCTECYSQIGLGLVPDQLHFCIYLCAWSCSTLSGLFLKTDKQRL